MSKSQKQRILDYLKQYGEITIKEMIYELGITRGAARIEELIKDDHQPIQRNKWRTVVRKDGTETQVRVYEYRPVGQGGLFGAPRAAGNGYGSPV